MLTSIQLILSLFWTSVGSAGAERLYHRRDHSDLQNLASHQARVITDQRGAQLFLSRYGFIKAVSWEEARFEGSAGAGDFPDGFGDAVQEAASLLDPRDPGWGGDPGGARGAFASALEDFQRVSGLPVTGVFDQATEEAMNKPRCGVPDKEADRTAAAPESDPPAGGTGGAFNETDGNSTESSAFDREAHRLNDTDDSDPRGHASDRTSVSGSHGGGDGRAASDSANPPKRGRREAGEGGYVAFSKRLLKWRLMGEGYSSQLSVEEQRYIFRLAFRMWSEVSPLAFAEDTRSPLEDVDIRLGFGTGRHLGCNQRFDGTGQEFAHAWFLGDIHFDDDEHFTAPNMGSGISLLKVAVHEIGHVLGLPHIYRSGSIMQPSYLPQESGFEMGWMDRKAIQHLYGGCKGRFSTVFDWIRKEKTPYGEVVIRFNTYFMRDGWYWLYENRNNRTRYGDPVTMQSGWQGLPVAGVDAHVHVWSRTKDLVYFFKGTQFWRYDSGKDRVFRQDPEGRRYPRPISEGFPGVVGPIDTAFYDRRDSNIYFFKNNLVYAFNVHANSLARDFPKNIRDVFPAVAGGDHPDGNIDAAYFSYTHGAVFLLKGTRYWRVAGGRERRRRPALPRNALLPHKEVEEQWFDICDVHPSALKLKR